MTVVHPSARCSRTNTSENAEHVSKYSVSLCVIVVVVRLVMRAGWTGLVWLSDLKWDSHIVQHCQEGIQKDCQEGIALLYDNECCKREYRVLTKFKNLDILFDYIFFALLVNLYIIMIILTIVRCKL